MTDTFFYADMVETATNLLDKFGFTGQLVKDDSSVGDYDDSGNYIAPTTATTIDCIITPIIGFRAKEIDGVSILASDGKIYLDCTEDPEIGMTTTINGNKYRLVKDMGMKTNAGDVLFRCWQVRGEG